jgi:hypothetical protein
MSCANVTSGTVSNYKSDFIRQRSAARVSNGGIPGMCPGQRYQLRVNPRCAKADTGGLTCLTIEEVKCSELADQKGSVFRLVVHDTTVHNITQSFSNTVTDPCSRAYNDANAGVSHHATNSTHVDSSGCKNPVQVNSLVAAPSGNLGAIVTVDDDGSCVTLFATLIDENNCCQDMCTSNNGCPQQKGGTGFQGPSAADGCGCCPCPCPCPCEGSSGGQSGATGDAQLV